MEITIYGIFCKDENILDCYIGSTTNFEQRKIKHKNGCISREYPVYKFITENGGWDNWQVKTLNILPYIDDIDKRYKEQCYINSYKPTLNEKRAYQTIEDRRNNVRKYRETEKYKNYLNSEKYKETIKSDKVKERKKEYAKTDKCKEQRKNYRQKQKFKGWFSKVIEELKCKNFQCFACFYLK